jgi:hypothetical protein
MSKTANIDFVSTQFVSTQKITEGAYCGTARLHPREVTENIPYTLKYRVSMLVARVLKTLWLASLAQKILIDGTLSCTDNEILSITRHRWRQAESQCAPLSDNSSIRKPILAVCDE